MEIMTGLSIQEKLHILADAAKYDVACTSSGVDRKGKQGYLGNSKACGICHSFASDGRCISLLKILMTNHCIYDCKYCLNRRSNDVVRTSFTPHEICDLTIEFYKRNYIEGLFLSSGVEKNPAYTMERICETLHLLRTVYRFNGYIHVKAIPGAPDELLARAGYLADRMSVNLELPTGESLKKLAPNKSHAAILRPMRMVSNTIAQHRLAIGKEAKMERSVSNRYLQRSIFKEQAIEGAAGEKAGIGEAGSGTERTFGENGTGRMAEAATGTKGSRAAEAVSDTKGSRTVGAASAMKESKMADVAFDRKESRTAEGTDNSAVLQKYYELPSDIRRENLQRPFASAGQSTQMIIGATPETDYHLIKTTQHLYQTYDLKRVFFSAYVPLNEDSALPPLGTPAPLLREHRLYQADWLLRFYGFQADELLSEEKPNFNELLDPKCDWALRHLGLFPVEVNTAPYDMILRIPGVGPKSAARIMQARRYGSVDFTHLKKMGVVLKRAHYFITCGGKMMYKTPIEEGFITRQLIGTNQKENWEVSHPSGYRQMSLFEDCGVAR